MLRRRSRGVSLVEVVTYVAIFTVISALVLGLTFTTLNLDRRMHRRIEVLRGIRLAQYTLMRTLMTLGDSSLPPYKISLSDTDYQPPRDGCTFDNTTKTSNCLMILKANDLSFWSSPVAYSGPTYYTLYFVKTGQIDPRTLEEKTELMMDPGTPLDDSDDFPILVSHYDMRPSNRYVPVVPGLSDIRFAIASSGNTYVGKVVIFDIVVERGAVGPGSAKRMVLRSLTSSYSAF